MEEDNNEELIQDEESANRQGTYKITSSKEPIQEVCLQVANVSKSHKNKETISDKKSAYRKRNVFRLYKTSLGMDFSG